MAKASIWLQGAKGQVAGMTLYQSGGSTIIRETRSAVSNPQTFAQMVQRVIAKTAMNQYSALQEIANHSFQGKSAGRKCMARFLSRNMNYFRERAAQIQAQGGSIYDFYQFSYKGEVKYTPAAVILSEGKLPRVITSIQENGQFAFVQNYSENSYQAVINMLGAKRGDQVTFVTIEKNISTGDYIPRFTRVILDPRLANGTPAPLSSEFTTNDNKINCPNMRNQGNFAFITSTGTSNLSFNLGGGTVVAAGVILSRKQKNLWLRSYCKLVLNEYLLGSDMLSLGDAVDASLSSNAIYSDDDLFLNNAGEGGPQGTSEEEPGFGDAVYSNIVRINGVEQDVSGGRVTIGRSLTSLIVNGAHIPTGALTLDNDGQSEVLTGSTSSVSWSGSIVVETIGSVEIKRNGVLWFTIDMINGSLE